MNTCLLYNEYGKVLITLITYPTKGLTLREISRLSKVSLGKTSEIIRKLEEEKIIRKEIYGNTYVIKYNFENEKAILLKRSLNISLFLNSELYREITKNYPKTAILLGSFEKGLDTENSDIDIAIISEAKPKINITRFLERNVSVHWFKSESEIPKELAKSLINGFIIYGFYDPKI